MTADSFTEGVRRALTSTEPPSRRAELAVIVVPTILAALLILTGAFVARASTPPQPGYDDCRTHPQLLVCTTVPEPADR